MEKEMSKTEIAEQIFQSIDLITEQHLSDIKYDRTIKVTITDDSAADKGHYEVSDGITTFWATSADLYHIGDIVYVTIPADSQNAQTLIIGKYVPDQNYAYNYANVKDTYLDLTDNLISLDQNAEIAIKANGSLPKSLFQTATNDELVSTQKSSVIIWQYNGNPLKEYNRLLLRGKFRSWLGAKTIVAGTYGLYLYVTAEQRDHNNNAYVTTECFALTSDEMYGNPYSFDTYFLQEKQFDIQGLDNITSMTLIFEQKNDFMEEINERKKLLEVKNEDPVDLFVTDVYVSLGQDISNIENDQAYVYSFESSYYDVADNDIAGQRTLYLRWAHFQTDDTIKVIKSQEDCPKNTTIHWYKYILNRDVTNKLTGAFWQEIVEAKNEFSCQVDLDPTLKESQFKVVIESPSRESLTNQVKTTSTAWKQLSTMACTKWLPPKNKDDTDVSHQRTVIDLFQDRIFSSWYLEPDDYPSDIDDYQIEDVDSYSVNDYQTMIQNYFTQYATETVDNLELQYINEVFADLLAAQAEFTPYESNVCVFENENYDPLKLAIDLISGLTITADTAGYQGNYLIYDSNGLILNKNDALHDRILTAVYKSLTTGNTDIDGNEIISWYFPTVNTMIKLPEKEHEYDEISSFFTPYDATITAELAALNLDISSEQLTAIQYSRVRRVAYFEPPESTTNDDVEHHTNQTFRIKDYYTQQAANNTIYCVVKKNQRTYVASITLHFGMSGSNGTDVTFLLEMHKANGTTLSPHAEVALTYGKDHGIYIVPKVFNQDNQDITQTAFQARDITYSWASPQQTTFQALSITKKDKNAYITIKLEGNNEAYSFADCHYHILKATIPWSIATSDAEKNAGTDEGGNARKTTLTAYLPIPVRLNEHYTVTGADRIIYNMEGKAASYYAEAYHFTDSSSSASINESDVTWSMMIFSDDVGYYPSFDTTAKKIKPVDLYTFAGKVPGCAITVSSNGSMIYTYPILIIQNVYGSAMLNAWDGGLQINDDNDTIMAAMLGAGKKDTNNTFTGVLMGDVQKNSGSYGVGLYGFHQGQSSFGFTVDGTAYIGKAGHGQIKFNGNNGTIESGTFSSGGTNGYQGMQIDLDGGNKTSASLKAYGAGGRFELDTSGKNSTPLLKLTDNSGNVLLKIGNGAYLLQSANYVEYKPKPLVKGAGVNFDLSSGKLRAYDFQIRAYKADAAQYISINSADENTPFSINGDFYIHWDGTFSAAGGALKFTKEGDDTTAKLRIRGLITADYLIATDGGKIGPFTIGKKDSVAALFTDNMVLKGSSLSFGSSGMMLTGNKLTFKNGMSLNGNELTFTSGMSLTGNKLTFTSGMTLDGNKLTFTSGMTLTGNKLTFINGMVLDGDELSFNGGMKLTGTKLTFKNGMSLTGNSLTFSNNATLGLNEHNYLYTESLSVDTLGADSVYTSYLSASELGTDLQAIINAMIDAKLPKT